MLKVIAHPIDEIIRGIIENLFDPIPLAVVGIFDGVSRVIDHANESPIDLIVGIGHTNLIGTFIPDNVSREVIFIFIRI